MAVARGDSTVAVVVSVAVAEAWECMASTTPLRLLIDMVRWVRNYIYCCENDGGIDSPMAE